LVSPWYPLCIFVVKSPVFSILHRLRLRKGEFYHEDTKRVPRGDQEEVKHWIVIADILAPLLHFESHPMQRRMLAH
ncbi:MAG TPA: hypothetical protein VK970_26450, partial [Candidatus Methylacidiphilales bacterium]|nr:hypothetical protein [Candidatus Methylacidiphilales bacterium]